MKDEKDEKERQAKENFDHWYGKHVDCTDLDTTELDGWSNCARTAITIELAKIFSENMRTSVNLVSQPLLLLLRPHIKEAVQNLLIKVDWSHVNELIDRLKNMVANTKEGEQLNVEDLLRSEEDKTVAANGLKKWLGYHSMKGKVVEQKIKDELYRVWQDESDFEEWWNNLLRASLCQMWSAYESLSSDLWESSINKAVELGALALDASSKLEVDGITNKQISFDLLRRHNFDLRSSMGTVF